MINIDLQQLIQALDTQTRSDLEKAAERCVIRCGKKVLIEDLLLSILATPDSLLNKAVQDAGIELGELLSVLQPRTESGESQNPVFSVELVQWLQDALLLANLELERNYIDQAALILALLRNSIRYVGTKYYKLLSTIDQERLKGYVLADQVEQQNIANVIRDGTESFLKKFTHNFTQLARENKLDPVLCRDDAIRQMIDILARRRKNNPIIVGEAGVGKTAVVEGLAIRIAEAEVPDILKNMELLALDMGLLQAGASMKGEFERRLKGLIDEVKASPKPIILFIDEAHTLIGSGGDVGGSDAANLLKPALARGELCTIAATTWSEYKKYFEKDAALARRFQAVQLHEPTIAEAITILRGLAPVYEQSHGTYLRDDAVVAAAELSARYLAGRQLPDKAVDVLDTASARVKISLAAIPEKIESLRSRIAIDEREYNALLRDKLAGIKIDLAVVDELRVNLEKNSILLEELTKQWQYQKELAEQLLSLRKQYGQLQKVKTDLEAELVSKPAEPAVEELFVKEVAIDGNNILEEITQVTEVAELQVSPVQVIDQLKVVQEELNKVHQLLDEAQENNSLVSFEVCPHLIAEVISNWTGIPVEQLAREHNIKVMQFADDLRKKVRGQEQAIVALDKAIRTSAAGLNRPDAPVGVFLFVGPSGVGKTETALALADLLYGGDRFLTVINMSEFQEKHTVSRLIGSPPGYVGYGEGGMLTEAVRQKPYSVILLDEVEKADPDVMNLFYQIFDKGIANDGEGREINFRNTIIIMTSNLGSEKLVALCKDGARPDPEVLEAAIRPTLSHHFKPALLGRMKVIPYYPVDGEVLSELIELKLERLANRMKQRKLDFTYDKELTSVLAERCTYSDSGARLIDSLLDQYIVPHITNKLLETMATKEELKRVNVVVGDDKVVACEFY